MVKSQPRAFCSTSLSGKSAVACSKCCHWAENWLKQVRPVKISIEWVAIVKPRAHVNERTKVDARDKSCMHQITYFPLSFNWVSTQCAHSWWVSGGVSEAETTEKFQLQPGFEPRTSWLSVQLTDQRTTTPPFYTWRQSECVTEVQCICS